MQFNSVCIERRNCCVSHPQQPDTRLGNMHTIFRLLETIAQSMSVDSPTIGKLFHDLFLLQSSYLLLYFSSHPHHCHPTKLLKDTFSSQQGSHTHTHTHTLYPKVLVRRLNLLFVLVLDVSCLVRFV